MNRYIWIVFVGIYTFTPIFLVFLFINITPLAHTLKYDPEKRVKGWGDFMKIGIIGAPNKGKSTLFSALTLHDVDIADYPFTTINPNVGVSYITRKCAGEEMGLKCSPRDSTCEGGIRRIPVNITDVAGLVEGAHGGKGMGNRFLDDLSGCDAFILVVDASGKTDSFGNHCDNCDPINDVEMVNGELVKWLSGIIERHMAQLSKKDDGIGALREVLSSFKFKKEDLEKAVVDSNLVPTRIRWSEESTATFSKNILGISKPTLIVANKMDCEGSEERVAKLRERFGKNVTWCAAAIELALRKAAQKGIIDYTPGEKEFNILKTGIPEAQASALKYMLGFITSHSGTNVQNVLNETVFSLLGNIVVYPVENENRYEDGNGNILPDALLMKRGSTAEDMAYAIHGEIGAKMLYAVDARTKMRVGKDYVLKDNDIIKIVSAAK